MNDFFKAIRNYLIEYLPKQRCYSKNTIKSYRQALNLMVEYLRIHKSLPLSKINFELFDREIMLGYLDWLESERGCSASTRNQRLMVLRSFFKYAGQADCAQISLHLDVKNIPRKKTPTKIVEFLSENALSVLLNQPNVAKHTEYRNRFFMILMYEIAARCDELLQLKVRDLNLNGLHPTAIIIKGKGDKTRIVPLFPKAVEHCKQYIQKFHAGNEASSNFLFFTKDPEKAMSPDNVELFMKKYGESAIASCAEIPQRVHPHQLRHTRAMHMYRDGMPLAVLAEFLGHADPETTKIYAYADSEMKRATMAKAEHLRKGVPVPEAVWQDNEEMILELSGLKV